MVLFHQGDNDQALSILRGFEGRAGAKGLCDRIVAEAQMTAFIFDAQDRLEELERGEALLRGRRKSESEYCKLRACITMAHILSRRGKREEAEWKCRELLGIQNAFRWEIPGHQRGLGVVVLAEEAALRGEFKESNVSFDCGLDILQMSAYGMLFSAMANKWFGDWLIRQDNRFEGLWHY